MGLFGNSTPTGPQRTVTLTKDPSGAPAVSADTIKAAPGGAADLVKQHEKAGFALATKGLNGLRGRVVALVDHSGSMKRDYQSGAVAKLLTRCLGLGMQLDSDGKIPVIPFDNRVLGTVEVDATNFSSAVDQFWRAGDMGTTNMTDAFSAVLEMAKSTDEPIILIVLTDGSPDHRASTTKVVCELASYPVFIKFMALRPVDYLSELDDLDNTKRLLDNVDAKPEKGSTLNLLDCSDAEFHAAMVDELDTWVVAATAAGVLKS